MRAKSLLNNLTRAGFRITINGDKLRISPRPVPPELLEAVKAHKPELMAMLSNSEGTVRRFSGYPVADGPFTPYCVPMSPDAVQAMRTELVGLIGKLSAAERWPDAHRENLEQTVHRQPLSSLRDDLAYFRAKWGAEEAVQRAAEAGRRAVAHREANRKCATCRYREHHETGVPIRCRHGRALGIAHHAWLDAPDTLNPCRYHELKRSKP